MKTKLSQVFGIQTQAFMEFNRTILEVSDTFAPLKQIEKEDSTQLVQ